MTSEFFQEIAWRRALQVGGASTPNTAFEEMAKYFTIAYNKLSPTQRMQVAEEITKITEV